MTVTIDAETIFNTARLMWSLTLSGRPTAHQSAAHEWMQAIRVGSLVAEISSMSAPAAERVGVVESITDAEDEVTITCLDGSTKRWTNATFVRVPRTEVERAAALIHPRVPCLNCGALGDAPTMLSTNGAYVCLRCAPERVPVEYGGTPSGTKP